MYDIIFRGHRTEYYVKRGLGRVNGWLFVRGLVGTDLRLTVLSLGNLPILMRIANMKKIFIMKRYMFAKKRMLCVM